MDGDGQVVTEKIVPQFVAEYSSRARRPTTHVWTRRRRAPMGTRVNRYGIKHCPKKLIEGGARDRGLLPDRARSDGGGGLRCPLYRTGPVRMIQVNIPPNERARDRQGRRAAIIAGER